MMGDAMTMTTRESRANQFLTRLERLANSADTTAKMVEGKLAPYYLSEPVPERLNKKPEIFPAHYAKMDEFCSVIEDRLASISRIMGLAEL